MTTYTVATGQKEALMLGRQGEYNVTEFVFDLSDLHAEIVADLRGAEGLKEEIEAAADDATARIQTAIGDADGKITDVQIAMDAADDKIDEINAAGTAAVQAAQAAANVSVVNETLVYGGAN